MNEQRESRLPAAKNDTLTEEERKALAKVDRYAPLCVSVTEYVRLIGR
jgi:hypothetical protein